MTIVAICALRVNTSSEEKVTCARTEDRASGEAQTKDLLSQVKHTASRNQDLEIFMNLIFIEFFLEP